MTLLKISNPVAIDDALDYETLVAATNGAIEQLARTFADNPGRTVRSLGRKEIENIAQGAVSGWILKRVEQHRRGVVPGSFADFLLRDCGVSARRV